MDFSRLTYHTSPDSWLIDRRHMIGASDAPGILGCGYASQSPFSIWREKTSDEPPAADEDNELFEFGHALQPVALQIFERRTGICPRDLGAYTIARHPTLPWLGATLDAWADDPEPAVIEAKNIGAHAG